MQELPFERLEFPKARLLTRREIHFIDSHVNCRLDESVIAVLGTQQIRTQDIRRLRTIEWVGDPIVNGYLGLAVARLREQGLNIHAVNSDVSMLLRGGRTYKMDLDPFAYDRVVLPVHLNDHWFGIGIDTVRRHIVVGDSLRFRHEFELYCILKWLGEMETLHRGRVESMPWRVIYKNVPAQSNNYDCGVFTVLFCIAILLDVPCADLWCQSDIANYREIIALDIIRVGVVTRTSVAGEDLSPTMEFALRIELELSPNQTARQLYTSLRASKRLKLGPKKKALNRVRVALNTLCARNEIVVVSEPSQREKVYAAPGYSSVVKQCSSFKRKPVALYPPPWDRQLHTLPKCITSLLHRYGKLERKQLAQLLKSEGYGKKQYNDASMRKCLSRMLKNKQIREIDGVYVRCSGNIPREWLSDDIGFLAPRRCNFRGTRCVFIAAEFIDQFFYRAKSALHGDGLFAKQFINCNTLVQMPCVASSADESFVIRGARDYALDSSAPTSYVNDAGPTLSQAELVLVKNGDKAQLCLLIRRAVSAGTELFCQYNSSDLPNAHWTFQYPGDWTSVFAYTILSRDRVKKANVRQNGGRSAKRHCAAHREPIAVIDLD